MTIELESMKLFPGYFQEDAAAPVAEVPSQVESAPVSVQSSADEVPADSARRFGSWTMMMGIVAGFCGLMGMTGILGGISDLYSTSILESTRASLDHLPASQETMVKKVVLDSQLSMQTFYYACAGFRFFLGVAFLMGSVQMFRRVTAANEFVATVCAGAIMYHLVTAVLTWMCIPSMEQFGYGAEVADVGFKVTIIIMVVSFLFNSAIHAFLIAYLYRKNNRNYFAPPTASVSVV